MVNRNDDQCRLEDLRSDPSRQWEKIHHEAMGDFTTRDPDTGREINDIRAYHPSPWSRS